MRRNRAPHARLLCSWSPQLFLGRQDDDVAGEALLVVRHDARHGDAGGEVEQPPTVIVDDSADTTTRLATFSSDKFGFGVSGLAGLPTDQAKIYWQVGGPGVMNSTLLGGSGANTFAFGSTLPGLSLTVSGGVGTNTVQAPDTANTWQITGSNAGSFTGERQLFLCLLTQ